MNINLIIVVLFNIFFLKFSNLFSSYINIYSNTFYDRKEIKKKISLIGGLYIFLNFNLISFLIFDLSEIQTVILLISNIFFIVGYLDDKLNLSPSLKLIIKIIILYLFLINNDYFIIETLRFSFRFGSFNFANFSIFFTLFCIIVFMNALNMYDGINGHSGTYIMFIFFTFYFYSNDNFYLILNVIIFIFLILNLKNYFFIGNSGIFFLSVFISLKFINFYQSGLIKFSDEILLIMFLPGIDLIRLFFTRLSNRKSPFRRDHNHWHHIVSKNFNLNLTLLFSIIISISPLLTSYFLNFGNGYIIVTYIIIYFYFLQYCKKKNDF